LDQESVGRHVGRVGRVGHWQASRYPAGTGDGPPALLSGRVGVTGARLEEGRDHRQAEQRYQAKQEP
jgi:hypothetical protein